MKSKKLRESFTKDMGIDWLNNQEEPEIDYVLWLEEKLINSSDLLQDYQFDSSSPYNSECECLSCRTERFINEIQGGK
jgi:hypothetical protein